MYESWLPCWQQGLVGWSTRSKQTRARLHAKGCNYWICKTTVASERANRANSAPVPAVTQCSCPLNAASRLMIPSFCFTRPSPRHEPYEFIFCPTIASLSQRGSNIDLAQHRRTFLGLVSSSSLPRDPPQSATKPLVSRCAASQRTQYVTLGSATDSRLGPDLASCLPPSVSLAGPVHDRAFRSRRLYRTSQLR
jgi:hypothetical protein